LTVVAKLKYHKTKNKETLLREAMEQIHKRHYYSQSPGRALLPGIAFSGTGTGCTMEVMERGCE
jgi:hypothetical protein